MRMYFDADHDGELAASRSRTSFVVFLNRALIYRFSKIQVSLETSTFGSKLYKMKVAMEYVRGLHYTLRMMGIPVDDPAFVFGYNQSVLCKTSNPVSNLKKKRNIIAFHHVHDGFAQYEWCTAYVNTHENLADILTKPLSEEKRWKFVRTLLHNL